MEIYFLFLLIFLMAFALGSGYPVAFALPGSAIISVGLAALCGYLFAGDAAAYFAKEGPHTWLSAGVTNFRGIYWQAERDTLIAIPLFIFMGIMLQRSKIAEDLLVTMAQLFGPIPGGLGISVVVVGGLLAATTGIVGATVVAMGLISLPAMLRNNYSHSLATGTIAASGTLGQIIPPSIVLIILADQLASAADQASASRKLLYKENTGDLIMPSAYDVVSTSAGEMFLGALIPGLVLVGLYVLYIGGIALLRPNIAPAVPYDGKYDLEFVWKIFLALVPPLALIFAVLGSIILGAATVNEAGSIGAAGAMIMAGYRLYRGKNRTYWPAILSIVSLAIIIVSSKIHPIIISDLSGENDIFWFYVVTTGVLGLVASLVWSGYRILRIDDTLRGVMIETAKTTSLVFIILLGAAMLTSAFRGFGGEELVKHSLTGLPGGFWGQFFAVMLVIFILGFFLDFIEIAVVVVPIVAPILLADPNANVTAVWLGVMIGLNIQTSFLTPPFGFALFYLRGVAPAIVRTISMYKGVVAFIILQITALFIVAFYPRLVNYLPQRVALTSETAPPPVNPGLQHCIEKYLFPIYTAKEKDIRSSIAAVKGLDYAVLPGELRTELTASFGKAEQTFAMVADVKSTQDKITASAVAYRPLHVRVRGIHDGIRRRKADIKEAQDSKRGVSEGAAEKLDRRIEVLKEEIKALEASIPGNWKQEHAEFKKLLSAEKIAILKYQRNADTAYTPVRDAVSTISAYDKLKELETKFNGLEGMINAKEMNVTSDYLAEFMLVVGKLPGAGDLRTSLYNVRRALGGREPSKEKALENLRETLKLYNGELAWRKQAGERLLGKLKVYEESIRGTIGFRMQSRIPDEVAVQLAGCTSEHRDLTLRF